MDKKLEVLTKAVLYLLDSRLGSLWKEKKLAEGNKDIEEEIMKEIRNVSELLVDIYGRE